MLFEHGANCNALNDEDRHLAHVATHLASPTTLKTLATLDLAGLNIFQHI